MRQEKKQATFFHEVDRRQGPNTWRPALVHLHPRAAPSAHRALLQTCMRTGDGPGQAMPPGLTRCDKQRLLKSPAIPLHAEGRPAVDTET